MKMKLTLWILQAQITLGLVLLDVTDASCSFPSQLRGLWISSYNGPMIFSETSIHGYRTKIPKGESLDLICSESDGSIYTLKSSFTVPVFDNPIYLFLCIEVTQLSEDAFSYKIRTEYQSLLKEYVDGHSNSSFPYMCTNGSHEELLLVRNVSASSKVIGTACPSIVEGQYDNMTRNGPPDNVCYDGSMSCIGDQSELTIYTDSNCMTNFGVSTFTCLHFSQQSGNHLYTWTNNSALWNKSPYGYFCLNITKDGDVLKLSIFPEVCSNMTDVILTLQLRKRIDKTEIKTTSTEDDTNINGSLIVVIIIAALICVTCTTIFLLHWNRKRLTCFRKKEPAYNFDDVATRS